ncbi:sensor histidine kinase [Spirosoma rhododendri]|uniref:histidine kinase n=1 Tax=Spirosoma rhododendri TaxID=2728024 RepID=A0A7L5DTX9_9BACT|nr:sensor histidine kinase [Spirosoma rhododendri]QJD81565.1 sensor histidine kinase [Spirosoma rhododendri]
MADSATQLRFIWAGNEEYRQKKGFASFTKSLAYYDSAQVIADRWKNRRMLARAANAKGRVYDAWEKEPQLTIRYYGRTAALYRPMTDEQYRYLYTTHLLAHAYEKARDTLHTVAVLTKLYHELVWRDTTQLKMYDFTPEMALIATGVGANSLATRILTHLTRRAWIVNDSMTYSYLDHYYLTRSRIDAYTKQHHHSPYIDSLTQVFAGSRNMLDSLYYAENLARLHRQQQRHQTASYFYELANELTHRLNNTSAVAQMQTALVSSELLVEKNKLAYQTAVREIRWQTVWILGALLLIISLLSFYLFRRNRLIETQAKRLTHLNEQLDDQIAQVQLLNKEIQHRVKNNLSMIYSLLRMQERKAEHPETLMQLQQARLRVESIATLHNQLISEASLINLDAYIRSMLDSIVGCYDKVVSTQFEIAPVSIPNKYYLPLALMLTEWVTNSLKHGLPPGDELTIQITLCQQQHELRVSYADNGQLVNQSPTPNLGMDIVTLLARQINGDLTVSPHNPYHYQLRFTYG